MVVLVFLYTCGAIVFSTLFIIYWTLIRSQKRLYDALRSQGVLGEPFVPLFGQIPDINRANKDDASMVYQMELAEKHGYAHLICFGPLIRLFMHEPDMIADVLGRSHAQDYSKTSLLRLALKPLIGTHNLLTSDGFEHERARKMLNPAFHFVNLQSMVSIMANQTAKAIDELLVLTTQKQCVDLHVELNTLTLAIIASSAFGNGFETITNGKEIMCRAFIEVTNAIEYRKTHLIDRIPIIAQLPFWHKRTLDKRCREVAEFVDQIIFDRRHDLSTSQCSGPDILDLLLSAVDDAGQSFSDQEIKEQALTFVFAGHETTGNLMTWVMYVLMTNEEVWHACRDEVNRVLPNGTELTYEHVSELVVCEAILQETLRLYPPAPVFTRQCIREHIIGSEGCRQLRIPIGTIISFNTYVLHRRADFWPRPLEFDYTRWMRDPVTGQKPKLAHSFCYLPFAAGPRNCIGQNFALLEAKVILATLVQRCDFEMQSGQKITPEVRVTMGPKYGLRAKVIKRS
jgi:cytochrome P450